MNDTMKIGTDEVSFYNRKYNELTLAINARYSAPSYFFTNLRKGIWYRIEDLDAWFIGQDPESRYVFEGPIRLLTYGDIMRTDDGFLITAKGFNKANIEDSYLYFILKYDDGMYCFEETSVRSLCEEIARVGVGLPKADVTLVGLDEREGSSYEKDLIWFLSTPYSSIKYNKGSRYNLDDYIYSIEDCTYFWFREPFVSYSLIWPEVDLRTTESDSIVHGYIYGFARTEGCIVCVGVFYGEDYPRSCWGYTAYHLSGECVKNLIEQLKE